MSNPSGKAQDNTARVWQPLDFVSPDATDKAFVKDAWAANELPSFEPFDLKKWEQAAEQELAVKRAALAQAKAQAARLTAEIDEIQESQKLEQLPTSPSNSDSLSEAELKKIRDEAHAKGVAEGRRLAQEEFEKQQGAAAKRHDALLQTLDKNLRGLMQDPGQWFEPMKRLALHLAEELVLAELTLSPVAIERLIQGCVGELSASEGASVKLELNPEDAKLLAEKGHQSPLWKVIPNDKLLPGSVRASAEDSVVCDLVEHRLTVLAGQLLQNPDLALSNTAFDHDKLDQRHSPEETPLLVEESDD